LCNQLTVHDACRYPPECLRQVGARLGGDHLPGRIHATRQETFRLPRPMHDPDVARRSQVPKTADRFK
jgi:hypothetical protein